MKSFVSDGVEITVPDTAVVNPEGPVIQILEGPHAGVYFKIGNMRMDDTDDALLWYDLDIVDAAGHNTGEPVDQIKPIVDNFILMILHEQIENEKVKNENQTAE